ncbi:MAG TPA: hypothetical protein VHC86_11355 [Opitutaceae bacterium]|nr:hypothetical protein [Opitutaceae bacterium]
MKASSLDILEKAALPPTQSHAILKVMESELAASHELLATTAELAAFRAEANARFDAVATKGELQALGSKLSWVVLTCSFTQLAFLAGMVYFLYAHPGR